MANGTTLGASHLASANFEVQRTNNFEIQVDCSTDTEKQRTITLAIVGGFLPSESNEVISLNYSNTTVTVAGKANANGSGSLTIRDFLQDGSDVEKIIDDWRAQVYDKETDAIGFAADYKKTAMVTQYAPDGSYMRVWKLKGVWPSAVEYGQVSYDSPGVKTINVTLQYDKAIISREDYSADSKIYSDN